MKFIKEGNVITIILPEKKLLLDNECSMCGIKCEGSSFDTNVELYVEDEYQKYYSKDSVASLISETIFGEGYKLCNKCLASIRAGANSNQSYDILNSYVKPKIDMKKVVDEVEGYTYYEGSIDIKSVDIPNDVIESLAIKYLSAKAVRTIKNENDN